MLVKDMEPGTCAHASLGRRIVAVLSRRVEGWTMYMDAVEGINHDHEWQEVRRSGTKQLKAVAVVILATHFNHDPEGCDFIA